MTPTVEYEVFDEDRPSYFPSYIMSAFVLVGIIALVRAQIPVWPLTLGHVIVAVWFGVLFKWILRNARQQKLFMSNRLIVTDKEYKHSFRYAVSEATHIEMPLSEIKSIKPSSDEPRYVEVIGSSDFDIYFLPKSADTDELVQAMLAGNPDILVER